ncbi:hypothetical protein OFN56_41085, partial [Escherichia coli]|nr:hypothetical protein [Escherichia coli]
YKMSGYDEDLQRSLLQYLSVDNVRVTLIAKGLEYNRTAKWYFTPYSVTTFSSEQKRFFQQIDPRWQFVLPEKNPYICYD